MSCPECQAKNPENALFCNVCGERLAKRSFWKRYKKWIAGLAIFFFLVIVPGSMLLLGLGVVGVLVSGEDRTNQVVVSGSGNAKIALINLDGVILDKAPVGGLGFSEEVVSARKIKKTLSEIAGDGAVRALLLRVNSPGGSAAASEEIYREILDFKARYRLPVVAYFSDLAASGGYYVAMPADKIVANPSAITGSIGVIISYLNFGDLAEKYGVKSVVYKSGKHKDLLSEFREPDDEERLILQGVVEDSFDNFVGVVARGRKMERSAVGVLADGRVFSAAGAKDAGLVDEIGTFEDAVTLTRSLAGIKEARVIEFGGKGLWESILEGTAGKFNTSLLPGMGTWPFGGGRGLLYLYNP